MKHSLVVAEGPLPSEAQPQLRSSSALDSDPFARFRRLACLATDAPACGVWFPGPADPRRPGWTNLEAAWLDAAPLGTRTVLEAVGSRVAAGEVVAVGDLRQHWMHHGAILPEPHVRSILAVPLPPREEIRGGTLCVLDTRVRQWSEEEIGALCDLAEMAAQEIAIRREADERRALENMVRMLGKAVENMQLGVTVTDLKGKIVYTNPAEARMHGYEVRELIGQHARVLGPPENGRALNSERMLEATSWTRETVNVRKDGSRFPVLLWSDLVNDANGEIIGIVTCSEDVTERKRAEEALRDVALRDPLTSLPNRVFFLDRLTQAIQASRRHADAQFAVLFLDLDRFKVVNDSLGHHVGDELLIRIARRLVCCLRPTDVVARFGGDEFAVLLEGVRGSEDAVQVAERIQEELSTPVHLDGYELFTSASIGIVMGSPLIEQPEYLWRSADMAMYRAKAAGTGRYELFDRAMHAEALARLQLETDLRRAVERDELRLFFQPIVCLRSGRIVGFEALLRWMHPLRGMIPPTEIIPAAEETGMIHAIGEWVLRHACAQLAEWSALGIGDPPLWMSVNLSSKQLSQPSLLDQLEAALRDSGVDPRRLRMEITESAVMEHTAVAAEILRGLKERGVELYMDDFGTGYSSLSYLHRLPLDALKIDRSFVSRMEGGNQHARLVETIINLARNVRLRVVAEGISSREQLGLLREMGCEYGQGFFFSQPLSSGDAQELMHRPPAWLTEG
jgi:diguanylate cyclase (GGDEF)-like protein/PAS domain S-box-containing protein